MAEPCRGRSRPLTSTCNHYASSVYRSRSGITKALADYVSQGITEYKGLGETATVDMYEVLDTKLPRAKPPACQGCNGNSSDLVTWLESYDAILLGSGVYNGNADWALMQWLQEWPVDELNLAWTVVNAFCTSGGAVAGAQPLLWSLQRAFQTMNGV